MKSTALVLAAVVAFLGCGAPAETSTPPEISTQQLRVVLGDAPIELNAGESLRIQLLVVGTGSETATISSPDLPPFAELRGSVLTLSPGRQYEGEYSVTLVATAGSATASATALVHVTRWNTAPAATTFSSFIMFDSADARDPVRCPGEWCTLDQSAGLFAIVGDADGDDVTVEVEVVRSGQDFSGIPTYSVTAPVGVPQNSVCNAAYDAFHTCIAVPFVGIAAGQSHSFGVRIRDTLGALASWNYGVQPVDGWVRNAYWRFSVAPCSDPGCFCMWSKSESSPTAPCQVDIDCCSNRCIGYTCE